MVHAHWLDCAAGRWAPAWTDINMLSIPTPLITYLLVCDVTPEGELRYRYWGRGHTRYHGKDYTGKLLSEMRPTWVRDFLNHQYMRVIETRRPRVFATRYENIPALQFSLRLPLSNDGETITGFLSFAERGGVADELQRWMVARGVNPVTA